MKTHPGLRFKGVLVKLESIGHASSGPPLTGGLLFCHVHPHRKGEPVPVMSSEFVATSYNTDRSSPGRFVWSHVKRHPFYGFLMIFGAFMNAAFASVVPYIAGAALITVQNTDNLPSEQVLQGVLQLGLLLMATQFVRGFVQFSRNFSAETFGQRIERDVRDELYGSLLGKSMTYHDSQPVGETMARVTNDVRELYLMFFPGFNLLIGSGMFVLTPLIASYIIHPPLVLVPLIFTTLYIWVQIDYMKELQQVARKVRAAFGRMNAHLAETLDGIEVVKGTAQEDREAEEFDVLVTEVRQRFIEQGYIESRYLAILLYGLAIFGAFVHAVILQTQGAISTGQLVQFLGQTALYSFPVFTSQNSFARIALGYAGAERILKVLNDHTDLDQNNQGYSDPLAGGIEFENVDFGYLDEPVLHDISFSVKPGQTVAIVGQTGAGKSTITKLLNRTYDVDTGMVRLDGVDVKTWNLDSLRSQISIIEQEIFLFSRSISDNIRFGAPDASMDDVVAAAKRAQAHDFIMAMEDQYDTIIGQRGVTLSGGQRQRLAIARAFLTNPAVLVLDDSTSAIDSATEDKIQRAIWEASQGRTTLLITHRLSQIRWADYIVVLKLGRIVAQGTHDDLIDSAPAYRRIFARYDEPTAVASD